VVEVELVSGAWAVVAVALIANLVGGLLAVAALARAANRRSWRRRTIFLAIASWALVESALYDTLFVVTTGFRIEGVQVRYYLPPIVLAGFAAIGVSTLVLLGVLNRMRTGTIVAGGAVVGALITYASYEGVRSLRTNGTVALDTSALVAVATFAILATSFTLLIAVRRPWRGSSVLAATLFAIVTTMTQTLILKALSFSGSAGGAAPTGFLPTDVIIPITMAFVVRVVVLVGVSLTETNAEAVARPAPGPLSAYPGSVPKQQR